MKMIKLHHCLIGGYGGSHREMLDIWVNADNIKFIEPNKSTTDKDENSVIVFIDGGSKRFKESPQEIANLINGGAYDARRTENDDEDLI